VGKKAAPGGDLTRRGRSVAAPVPKAPRKLLGDLRKMIDQSRQDVARAVNTALVGLYWNIGKRTREHVLNQKRAEYGEEIVSTLSR
jgi:hypothetical protein